MPSFFFFNDTATTELYTLSLHDALPIFPSSNRMVSEDRSSTNSSAKEPPRARAARRTWPESSRSSMSRDCIGGQLIQSEPDRRRIHAQDGHRAARLPRRSGSRVRPGLCLRLNGSGTPPDQGTRTDLIALGAVAGGLLIWYVGLFVVRGFAYPVGPDGPVYLWWT